MSEPLETPEDAEPPPFDDGNVGSLLVGPDALDVDEASAILAKAPGRVVVWAGERASGKTTLTCELYERQRRPGSPVSFAGSQTLLALEQRAHPSRAASGRRVRETRRTERDPEGRELLHLGLVDGHGTLVNLLIADLPGEVFRDLRDNVSEPDELPLLARADKLALLADGRRLADPLKRAQVVSGIRQLLHRLTSRDLPDQRTELALVVTKWDQVVDDSAARDYWLPREVQLTDEIRSIDAVAPILHVAARPLQGWQHDDGVDSLRDWVMDAPRVSADPSTLNYIWPTTAPPRLKKPKRLLPA